MEQAAGGDFTRSLRPRANGGDAMPARSLGLRRPPRGVLEAPAHQGPYVQPEEPPSTKTSDALTKAASSLHRNAATLATSAAFIVSVAWTWSNAIALLRLLR